METTYPSKRDLWLSALAVLSGVACAAAGLAVWAQPGNLVQKIAVCGICVAATWFVLDLHVRTNYTLGLEGLKIRCGILRWSVPYSAIQSVRRSRTLLSGPALSMDRLAITRNDSRWPLIISPVDQPRFLDDLASRDAGLKLIDGGLVRSAG